GLLSRVRPAWRFHRLNCQRCSDPSTLPKRDSRFAQKKMPNPPRLRGATRHSDWLTEYVLANLLDGLPADKVRRFRSVQADQEAVAEWALAELAADRAVWRRLKAAERQVNQRKLAWLFNWQTAETVCSEETYDMLVAYMRTARNYFFTFA